MTTAEEIYKLYPRHVGKKAAIKEIGNSLRRLWAELENEGKPPKAGDDMGTWMKHRVQKFANSPAGNRGQFTPHPATWFHQSRYLDDEAEWEHMTPREAENVRQYREANVGVWRPQ